MSKFKVGDKVKAIKYGYSCTGFPLLIIGKIYKVESVEGTIITVEYEPELHHNYEPILARKFDCTNFELVEETNQSNRPKKIEFTSDHLNELRKKAKPLVELTGEVGTKNDQEKPDPSLIPTDAIMGMAAALSYGAKKYDRHNFRKGIAFSRLVAAALRHLTAWNEGENLDKESGLSHLDHALASLAMLKFMDVNRQDMDDRWINPVKMTPDEIREYEGLPKLTEQEKLDAALEIQKRGR